MSTETNTPVEETVKSMDKLRVGKVTYDVATLQATIDRVQSLGGRVKQMDLAKESARTIREIDGKELAVIDSRVLSTLLKAEKIKPREANLLKALEQLHKALSLMNEV